MEEENSIFRILKSLERHGIYSTKDFLKDILRQPINDIEKFTKEFYRDFSRKQFHNYNKFERLNLSNLSNSQKKDLSRFELWRYEYRNKCNLRCIFIVPKVNNTKDEIILLCAFCEDGDKKKGKDSYNDNINRAIKIINKIKEK
jgi:hypothetical protein